MKKLLITTLLLVMVNVLSYAQVHLQFMEIPINGTFDSFKEELEAKDIHKDSYNKWGFSGYFFGTIAGISVDYNEETENVYGVTVRYNQSMTNKSESELVALYKRIAQGLKKKYPRAKDISLDGTILLVLTNGYIEMKAFKAPAIFGGVTIELTYVDKLNSPSYKVPVLKSRDEDL
ncbi:MAG: hypothetical protein K2L81_08285 [Muribaculaceae bacterium]|nr:hypothetical protein [Muribaculaceae bacterium]